MGGRTPDGAHLEVKLLRDSGWCGASGFPDITEPLGQLLSNINTLEMIISALDNPGVYYKSGILLVCGFTSGSPCKYTYQGSESWSDVLTDLDDVQYKMTYSSKVGSVMAVSKGVHTQNHIQHNPVVTNPVSDGLTPWMEISGSPFNVSTGGVYPFRTYMDISNSCLGRAATRHSL